MPEQEIRFPENLRIYRETFGETQMGLAFSLGLESPNTISNYENGTRFPEPEILRKIAWHYRVPQDELLYAHLEAKKVSKEQVTIDYLAKLSRTVFPVFCPEEALDNEKFQEAYRLHMKFLKGPFEGDDDPEEILYQCVDLYLESEEKAASANILGLLAQVEHVSGNSEWMVSFIEMFDQKGGATGKEVYRNFLRDCDMEPDEETQAAAEALEWLGSEDKEEAEKLCLELLQDLRTSQEWQELAYYYLAIYEAMGWSLSGSPNRETASYQGIRMLSVFARMGNPYAKKTMKILSKII